MNLALASVQMLLPVVSGPASAEGVGEEKKWPPVYLWSSFGGKENLAKAAVAMRGPDRRWLTRGPK
jgi:hypothetical protein